jgi:predicted dehydrogenase
MSASASTSGGRTRFALVGAGVIGKHHGLVMSQLSDRVELVAVVDRHLSRAEELAAARGGKAFESLTAALADAKFDVVARSRSRRSRQASTSSSRSPPR